MKFSRRLTVCRQLTILGYSSFPRNLSSSSSSSSSGSSSKLKRNNYYDVLGVNKTSSRKDIRRAFIEKSKEYHPDSISRSDLSSEQLKSKFQEINEAYQTLNDPTERQVYDESIRYPKAGYSGNSNWRQGGYGNYSDYQQYRAHQEFMRQQGHYWANYNRQSFNQSEDISWKSFFRYKMGQPITVAHFLLFIFVVGVTIEIFHTVYIFRYFAAVKRERAMFGPDWFENNKKFSEIDDDDDDEVVDRLVYMEKDKHNSSMRTQPTAD